MVNEPVVRTKRQELGVFLLLTAVMVPVLTVLIIAAYGFSVWIWQMLSGPAGH